jgi:hypothetical protein
LTNCPRLSRINFPSSNPSIVSDVRFENNSFPLPNDRVCYCCWFWMSGWCGDQRVIELSSFARYANRTNFESVTWDSVKITRKNGHSSPILYFEFSC